MFYSNIQDAINDLDEDDKALIRARIRKLEARIAELETALKEISHMTFYKDATVIDIRNAAGSALRSKLE